MNIIFNIIKYLKNHKETIFRGAIITIMLVTIIALHCIAVNVRKSEINYMDNKISTLLEENKILAQDNEKITILNQTLTQTLDDKEIIINNLEDEKFMLEEENAASKEQIQLLHTQIDSTYDEKYEAITIIWNYLKSMGLNDHVCAGIIGNIMIECGGGTLVLNTTIINTNEGAFGICQWRGARKDRLINYFGMSIYDQCRFLSIEMYEVIPKGSHFYNMQNERDAALYFAQTYERCHSDYYAIRQESATKAYNYFVGNR